MAQVDFGVDARDAVGCEDRLIFTAHSLVRYLERYVDTREVGMFRRLGLSDSEILAALRPRYARQLDEFVARFGLVHDRRSSQFRNVTSGISYRLHLGPVRIVVCGGVCVTTLAVWN